MVSALAVTALLKLVTALRIGGRRVQRAVKDYALSRARLEIAAEQELWRQSQWDLEAAKKLRKRLVRHAELWIMIPARLPQIFEEHPEYRPFLEKMQKEDQAAIAALDATVRRVFGGYEGRLGQ